MTWNNDSRKGSYKIIKKDAYKIVKLIEWQINDKNIDVDIPSRKSIIDRIKGYYLKEK